MTAKEKLIIEIDSLFRHVFKYYSLCDRDASMSQWNGLMSELKNKHTKINISPKQILDDLKQKHENSWNKTNDVEFVRVEIAIDAMEKYSDMMFEKHNTTLVCKECTAYPSYKRGETPMCNGCDNNTWSRK